MELIDEVGRIDQSIPNPAIRLLLLLEVRSTVSVPRPERPGILWIIRLRLRIGDIKLAFFQVGNPAQRRANRWFFERHTWVSVEILGSEVGDKTPFESTPLIC